MKSYFHGRPHPMKTIQKSVSNSRLLSGLIGMWSPMKITLLVFCMSISYQRYFHGRPHHINCLYWMWSSTKIPIICGGLYKIIPRSIYKSKSTVFRHAVHVSLYFSAHFVNMARKSGHSFSDRCSFIVKRFENAKKYLFNPSVAGWRKKNI